jgi:hypothetical protein
MGSGSISPHILTISTRYMHVQFHIPNALSLGNEILVFNVQNYNYNYNLKLHRSVCSKRHESELLGNIKLLLQNSLN